jgi:hypothetical protein
MSERTWVSDANGNRCSSTHFGSLEAAQTALDSLKDCKNCTNCSDCSDCSRCSYAKDKIGDKYGQAWMRPPTPVIADIHQTVYAAASAPKALDMRHWHCGTTHCRAGWVVTLAGEEGKALEEATSTLHAAMLIYRASDPTWRMSDFLASNESALNDMKLLAIQGKANHESE